MQDKRISARAIIIHEEKLVSMYRERQGEVYYTFPGGGKEKNENTYQVSERINVYFQSNYKNTFPTHHSFESNF